MSDEELLQACRTKAQAGSTFVDSNLAAERREVHEYYVGKRLNRPGFPGGYLV